MAPSLNKTKKSGKDKCKPVPPQAKRGMACTQPTKPGKKVKEHATHLKFCSSFN